MRINGRFCLLAWAVYHTASFRNPFLCSSLSAQLYYLPLVSFQKVSFSLMYFSTDIQRQRMCLVTVHWCFRGPPIKVRVDSMHVCNDTYYIFCTQLKDRGVSSQQRSRCSLALYLWYLVYSNHGSCGFSLNFVFFVIHVKMIRGHLSLLALMDCRVQRLPLTFTKRQRVAFWLPWHPSPVSFQPH